ncbi:MAG: DUF4263 domain-containing protein [Burkholderiales bacterium]|nr:DUF4263 domain-containing protein [Burkholderiales bacterium]
MAVTIERVAEYLMAYAGRYREDYAVATMPRPRGPGYPAWVLSPYLHESSLDVYVASDGVVIAEEGEPPYQWFIAGGPAMKVDYEPTRTPDAVSETLASNGLLGKPIGIFRIVAKTEMPAHVWRGQVCGVVRELRIQDKKTGIAAHVREVNSSLKEVVQSLTFGAYGLILDVHLPTQESQFGESHLTRNLGMFPADLSGRRFFEHLEVFGHADACAWDTRSVGLRVQRDLRRDLAAVLSNPEGARGGSVSLGSVSPWIEAYNNRLEHLEAAISELRAALRFQGDAIEAVFHAVLEKHPLLLDVYGVCESRPELAYPPGYASPIGKSKLQPDFLIRYPDESYKLVEIERPAKLVATAQGQPRSEVGQAVFQTAEWKHFIKTHYQVVAKRYPGIQAKCRTAVVMSRLHQESFKNIDDARAYMGLMMEQFNIDEFLTFDDLLERACTAYALIAGLRTQA